MVYRSCIYQQLVEQAEGLATALLGQNFGRGDRMAIIAENNPERFIAYMAVLAAGAAQGADLFYQLPITGTRHVPCWIVQWPLDQAGIAAMTGLQLLLTCSTSMNRLFHTAPIDGPAWGLILAAAVTVYVVVETETWLRWQWKRRTRSAASARGSA